MSSTSQPIALITGGGRGLGLALARALLSNGWRVVTDARRAGHLAAALPGAVVVPGDVTDQAHREALAEVVATLGSAAGAQDPAAGALGSAAGALGRLDLLVNNASDLGPSPLPRLDDVPLAAAREVFETNVLAPLALIQQFLPALVPRHRHERQLRRGRRGLQGWGATAPPRRRSTS